MRKLIIRLEPYTNKNTKNKTRVICTNKNTNNKARVVEQVQPVAKT